MDDFLGLRSVSNCRAEKGQYQVVRHPIRKPEDEFRFNQTLL